MDLPGLTPNQLRAKGGPIPAPPLPKQPAAFDLKGTMAPLTVLRLRSSDIQLVDRQLRVRISQLPHMFLNAPVMIDLGALDEASPLTVIQVVAILKACKLVPVAATNVPEAMRATIANEGLGILQAPPAPGRTRNIDAEIDAMPDPDLPTPPAERVLIPAAAKRGHATPAPAPRAAMPAPGMTPRVAAPAPAPKAAAPAPAPAPIIKTAPF